MDESNFVTKAEFNHMIQNFYLMFITLDAADKLYLKAANYYEDQETINNILTEQEQTRKKLGLCVYRQFFSLKNLFDQNKDYIVINENTDDFVLNNINQTIHDLDILVSKHYDGKIGFVFTDADMTYTDAYFIFPIVTSDNFKLYHLYSLELNKNDWSLIISNHELNNNQIYMKYYLLTYDRVNKIFKFQRIYEDDFVK